MIKAAAAIEAGIRGAEFISTPPCLFFTLAPAKTSQQQNAVKVLRLLEKTLNVIVFPNIEKMLEYFSDSPMLGSACAIFEDTTVRKCFSPICRRYRSKHFPEWAASAFWGIAINPKLREKRITTVANQVKADFSTNFGVRTEVPDHFPWGEPPSSLRKKRKRQKRQASFCDW